jgi:hypothetical protein
MIYCLVAVTLTVCLAPAALKLRLPELVAVSTTVPAALIVATFPKTVTTAGFALTNRTGKPELLLATSGNVALLEKTGTTGAAKLIVCVALAMTMLPLLLP